jgi:hypothetical protein
MDRAGLGLRGLEARGCLRSVVDTHKLPCESGLVRREDVCATGVEVRDRSEFTADEIETVRGPLRETREPDRERPKALRAKIPRLGFYITDFATETRR